MNKIGEKQRTRKDKLRNWKNKNNSNEFCINKKDNKNKCKDKNKGDKLNNKRNCKKNKPKVNKMKIDGEELNKQDYRL